VVPRVRFAPSPTGFLHVGGARTALFNWLYARREGGTFILRIDDTDTERSSAEMTAGILEGLRWLGLAWDEGPEVGGPHAPYFQSARLDRYRAVAQLMVAGGAAYKCFCTAERLQAERELAEKRGDVWRYDRRCLALAPDEAVQRETAGERFVIRFRVPEGRTVFDDAVRGTISVAHETIEDLVIVRSDGQPTYHLSNVVDDVDMRITHVLRGDDHISNTPKHILLFRALGAEPPAFAHLPLILGPDKKRLSKRHGAASVAEYREQGFLPDALINFLALLGWSPRNDREVMSRAELLESFSLDGVSGGNAVFDAEKLEWMNAQHIAGLPAEALASVVRPLLAAEGLWPAADHDDAWLHRLLELLRPRAKRLGEFAVQGRVFLVDAVDYEPDAVARQLTKPEVPALVDAVVETLGAVDPFDEAHLELAVRGLAERLGVKAGAVIHPVRVGLTGRMASPGIFEVMTLLGRARVLARLEALRAFLARPGAI
jgi:glutamyl-tRNA synthetase